MVRQDDGNMLEAARGYLARGYMPVPLSPGDKNPFLDGWQHMRLTEEELPRWFSGRNNIGVILGEPSGWLVDVDLDCDEAIELADEFLPPTPVVTGRGGRPRSHRWYICPRAKTTQLADPVTNKKIVELRSTGAQTAVGPSVHPDGDRYDMLEGEPAVVDYETLKTTIEALAAEVCRRRGHDKRLDKKSPDRQWRPTRTPRSPIFDDRIPMKTREKRCQAYLEKCPDAIPNAGGHDATLRAACECYRFGLDRPTAEQVMEWFNQTKCVQETWSPKEIAHKLESAERKVRECNEFGVRFAAGTRRDGLTLDETARQLTDIGNAARFVVQHGARFRYSYQRGGWFAYDGRRWKSDQTGEAMKAAKATALAILDEAKDGSNEGHTDAIRGWAKASQRHDRLKAMLALAQPELAVVSDDLDADPWLFNCLSGTLDLRTKSLRPHDAGDLITMLAPVDFTPDAPCERFERFLNEIFGGDPELIGFVQQWHGYCLTGDVRHQHLPIYHGEGNNGKSVLLDTVSWIMGDYAAEAPPELLIARKHAQHPTEIADLAGRRLVVASETETGAELRIETLKRLTGNARLKGRLIRQDFFEFDRTHKMVLVTNNRPEITEDSEAVWRRVLLVPFDVVIPPERRDPGLMDTLRSEAEGILAWMVLGCPAPEAQTLAIPDAVRLATDQYRGRSNSLDEFIDECCELERGAVTSSGDITAAYERWAIRSGSVPLKARAVAAVLRRRGCRPVKSGGVRAWSGICIDLEQAGHIGQIQAESPVDEL